MSEEAICICEKHDFYDFFPNNEKTKCPCCEVEHLTEQLNSKQDALSAALLALDNAVSRAAELEAELARYNQGVEVEVTVDSFAYGDTSFICEDIKLPSEFRGQRVRVLIMKEEVGG